jgi:hypothetical protein
MNYSTSTGLKTADYQIYAGPGSLNTIFVDPPSVGVATLTIYDSANSAVSGKTELVYIEIPAGVTSDAAHLTLPVAFNFGAYAVLTGTGAGFIAHFCAG